MTVTTCGWFSCATALASRRKRSSWAGSLEMSRCIILIATRRSSVGSNARYTLDIPPDPTFSSSRNRSPMRVPITVIYFPLSCAGTPALPHRPGVPGVVGRRARPARSHPRVRGAVRISCYGVARPRRPLRHALRPAALDRGSDPLHLPGLHGGEGGRRAGPRRGQPLPAGAAGGADVPAAQTGRRGGARGGGARRGARRGAFPHRPRLTRDRGGVRRGPGGHAGAFARAALLRGGGGGARLRARGRPAGNGPAGGRAAGGRAEPARARGAGPLRPDGDR